MLKLRPYKKSDANIITNWITDEKALRMWSADRYGDFPITAKDMNDLYDAAEENDSFWAMTAFDESGIVGHLTMRFTDDEKKVLRFGFVIVDLQKRGQGYGKEMLKLALHYAFHIVRVEKVTLGVFEKNKEAYHCYSEVGFVRAKDIEPMMIHLSIGDYKNLELEMLSDYGCMIGVASGQQKWDSVTGMYNSQGLVEKLEQWKQEGRFSATDLMMICMDVDGLSNINNIYGRAEGDAVIQTLAKIIDDTLSKSEAGAHTGGSEFIIAFPAKEQQAKKQAEDIVEIIKSRIATFNSVSGKDYDFDINYRFVCSGVYGTSSMFEIVDNALRSRKIAASSEELQAISNSKKAKEMFKPAEEQAIRDILDHNLFRYAFQPIIDAKTGEIYGYEALMRSGTDVQVSPLTILQYATLMDRLEDIERATINNVLDFFEENREAFGTKKVFINSIPGHYLPDEEFEEHIVKYKDVIGQAVIEVTEQTELDDKDLDIILKRSEKCGFHIAIDDYGSGYSNTSSLLRYIPNCVKIDRLLISNIHEEPKKQHFVKSIIEFCHDNGILVLAEGVEESTELKAVIGMGVDLIQGYYTARPSFEVLQSLPENLMNEIVHANRNHEKPSTRKVFMVDGQKELPLMRLELEQYTGILLANQDVVLVGNGNYDAGLSIKIKDDATCRLTLRDVSLESVNDMPCIDIGKGAHLTLVLEGDNKLEGAGIRVPEESSITLEGNGNLDIHSNTFSSYGIGTEAEVGVGSIICNSSGELHILVDGSTCIGIGGGIYRKGSGIEITAGSVKVEAAGVEAVGIGCLKGDIPIDMKSCHMAVDIRVFSGVAIGSVSGNQNVNISSVGVEIAGSGSNVCGIGSNQISGGSISIANAKVNINLNGQQVILLGSVSGAPTIRTKEAGIEVRGEGGKVLGVGAFDESAVFDFVYTTVVVHLRAGDYVPLGAKEENRHYDGGDQILFINED